MIHESMKRRLLAKNSGKEIKSLSSRSMGVWMS